MFLVRDHTELVHLAEDDAHPAQGIALAGFSQGIVGRRPVRDASQERALHQVEIGCVLIKISLGG